jgi:hypothetical protein
LYNCIYIIDLRKEAKQLKIVDLCGSGGCCPVVKIGDDRVEIGEDENTCVLTTTEWEMLKKKVLTGEL